MEILGYLKNATAGSEGGTARDQEPVTAGTGRPGECLEAVGSKSKTGPVWNSPQVSPFCWLQTGQKTLDIDGHKQTYGRRNEMELNKTLLNFISPPSLYTEMLKTRGQIRQTRTIKGDKAAGLDKTLSKSAVKSPLTEHLDITCCKLRSISLKGLSHSTVKDFGNTMRQYQKVFIRHFWNNKLTVNRLCKDFVQKFTVSTQSFGTYEKHEIYEHNSKPVSLQVSSDEESFCSTRTVIYSPGLEDEMFPKLWEAETMTRRKVDFSTPSPNRRAPEPSKNTGSTSGAGRGGSKNGPTRGGGGGASSSRGGGGGGASRGGGAAGNAGGGKRNADGDARKPKKTFAEMTKDLKVIEVRASDPKYPLKQDDFDCLEFKMLHIYLDMPNPGFVYSTPRPGLSQGAVWYGCANEGTYNFIKETAPEVDPPEEKPYRYIIAAGDKRYIKIRCAKKFWMSRDRFLMAIRRQNPELDQVMEDGVLRESHMVITSGLEDDGKDKAIKDGFFMVGIEIEEASIDAFVRKRGEILVGNSTLRVTGAGIDARIEEADRIEADRVREEESVAHGGPSFNF